jgi:hypothetical protein
MARAAATSMAMVRAIATPVRRQLRPIPATRPSSPFYKSIRMLLPLSR